MSSLEAIPSVRPEVRELKPELDRALLQSYELEQFYNLQEMRMIQPIAVRDEDRHRVAPIDPALVPATPIDRAPAMDDRIDDGDLYPEVCAVPRAEFSGETSRAAAETRATEHRRTADDARSATPLAVGSSATTGTAVLPYGSDTQRVRQLVEWIMTGREAVPFAFHYRQAGDLVEVQGQTVRQLVSPRQVAAVYKAY